MHIFSSFGLQYQRGHADESIIIRKDNDCLEKGWGWGALSRG